MNKPNAYQITMRINQLIAYYGKQYVHDCIFFGDTHYNFEIGQHVDNLLLCYGTKSVLNIADLIFKQKGKVA